MKRSKCESHSFCTSLKVFFFSSSSKDADVATKLQKEFDEMQSERSLQKAKNNSLDEDAVRPLQFPSHFTFFQRLAARLQAEEEMRARNELKPHQHGSSGEFSYLFQKFLYYCRRDEHGGNSSTHRFDGGRSVILSLYLSRSFRVLYK